MQRDHWRKGQELVQQLGESFGLGSNVAELPVYDQDPLEGSCQGCAGPSKWVCAKVSCVVDCLMP